MRVVRQLRAEPPLSLAGCLGGRRNAGDVVVLAGDDDGFRAVGALKAQDAAVLDAAPADRNDQRENGEAEQDGHERRR